jgi:hypothetical protein
MGEVNMARWSICRAYLTVQSTQHEYSRAFGPGAQVDLDEVVAPGVTIADLVAGREDCFSPVEEAPSPAARTRAPKLVVVPSPENPPRAEE